MRRLALVLALVFSTQAVAAPTQRSLVSGVGVGLLGLGVGALGFSVGQLLVWLDTDRSAQAYATMPPSSLEGPAVTILRARGGAASTGAIVSALVGVGLITGGIIALVLDRPREDVSLFLLPTPSGGAVGLTGSF